MSEQKVNFRILVIDDERFSRAMVVRYLTTLGAETVKTAASAAEARAAMNDDPELSLILCDHYMPDDNGLKLLWDLRRGEFKIPHDTRFMIATASKSYALASVALALDADSFLSKPFSKDELARRLYVSLVSGPRNIKMPLHYRDLNVPGMLAAAERADPAAPKVASAPMRPLRNVLPDTPLGSDLTAADGTRLLLAGTVLTRHLIARLHELGITEVPIATP